MTNTFNIITLGCKVNQYESEAVEELFIKKGYEKVSTNADIYVINTCTVTNMSDRKSRQMISRARRDNPNAVVAVMGCYSQVKPEEVASIEGVDIVLGSRNKENVVEHCEDILQNKEAIDKIIAPSESKTFEELQISNQTEMTRAYLKIQDGCNMYCSYCLIPYARGNIVSRDIESIVEESKRLANNNFKEIVLTGIHVSSYGKDIDDELSLIDVIEAVAEVEGIERIRLSSMEPRHISLEFLERMKATKKACDHFHLSLQSGSDDILKAMNRKYDTVIYKQKVEEIRQVFPNAGITTDIIVGFPGETEENHKQTMEYAEEIKFSKMHLFKYSPREGTRAAKMSNQIDGKTKKNRLHDLEKIEEANRKEFLNKQIGKTLSVLIESKSDLEGYSGGHSTNYLKVNVKENIAANTIIDVNITNIIDDELVGEIVEKDS
ncbi:MULTISPECIES: tRNA (N(6)-L-threonylcarbamoyladenosine(37)-C(2))-methylthiotransferase MtaB [Anaerococcus]|uniref:tRNA (N(6)-L-threonylcarbamoyladenosine(37)-C(2))- methylthiotransferase MtaB n=1 Tax=Anaerococcus TaxID=165779 RepID=UPI0023578345|nr:MULTISPECIES: tRNA (N(6)-L-threonylcarbamoyladenosine(37)-C(2))-methylthiotransferase MtaB [Anaerococcus]MBS6105929.1 tRNA (N(6)-L-threonylcarbamoyladenosine(37)-C(2))-methylthiotransferase MtaB [Anaerococcus sp.]MDU0894518.1 tRNA (N(6)-L-threonylcarbamoyladenosine(37)-C(2))-methylthiotransferase MtaB [Anaerococcus sp.]MDU2599271.1 tRNA (N(6)-L-threonylcarbamoyladenosine(37)-C(2))-methylthiotransferase MtaB [Anaerococcus sp.]MDU3177422.1 tRNA (N(6)-L-threonylcarbamoyladenosine(37)-C(2))-meth